MNNSFQARVMGWMERAFLPSLYNNWTERGDRLLEEVLELLQANGYNRVRVATLVDYVYGRPPGEPGQEVGGVMVTLAGYCGVTGWSMHDEGERELERIMQPEVITKIRAKQAAKNALHFDTPLPGCAVAPSQQEPDDMIKQRNEFDAADQFAKALARHNATPVVDDDYPRVRHDYESALHVFIKAMAANGRINRRVVVSPELVHEAEAHCPIALWAANLSPQPRWEWFAAYYTRELNR